ncbi:hypothetical protein EDB86DRAFT_2828914 [Lactarius hatsudake]|nr:hypothetical protein EDB86DRAFT_2828914 [Lactarius hatsudake]
MFLGSGTERADFVSVAEFFGHLASKRNKFRAITWLALSAQSSSVTTSFASLTLPSRHCRRSSVKASTPRPSCRRFHALSKGRAYHADGRRPALKRNEQVHAQFRTLINRHYSLEQLVFADEGHFHWLTSRRPYVWSIRGEHQGEHRATRTQFEFFLQGTKYSIFLAISLGGILHLRVLENVVTGDKFSCFVHAC